MINKEKIRAISVILICSIIPFAYNACSGKDNQSVLEAFSEELYIDDENNAFFYSKEDGSNNKIQMAVKNDGQIQQLIQRGLKADPNTEIPEVLYSTVGPDKRTYIILQTPIEVQKKQCVFIRVKKKKIQCVDADILSVELFENSKYAMTPLVFNGDFLYYVGTLSAGSSLRSKNYKKGNILKEVAKEHTNLNINLQYYTITESGLYIYGTNNLSGTSNFHLRKLDNSGQLKTILNVNNPIPFFKKSESAILFNLKKKESEEFEGFVRLDLATDTLIQEDIPVASLGAKDGYDITNSCSLPSGETFIVNETLPGIITRVSPSFLQIQTSVNKFGTLICLSDKVIYSGINQNNQYAGYVYDLVGETEHPLFDEEIEIYKMDANDNTVIFQGLRFSDNKFIIGLIDLKNLLHLFYEELDASSEQLALN